MLKRFGLRGCSECQKLVTEYLGDKKTEIPVDTSYQSKPEQ